MHDACNFKSQNVAQFFRNQIERSRITCIDPDFPVVSQQTYFVIERRTLQWNAVQRAHAVYCTVYLLYIHVQLLNGAGSSLISVEELHSVQKWHYLGQLPHASGIIACTNHNKSIFYAVHFFVHVT